MNPPLKPCYKCGAPALLDMSVNGSGEEYWQITCSSDGCPCKPIKYRPENSRSRAWAVQTWNKRAVAAGEGE